MSDIEEAYTALVGKSAAYLAAQNYYNGNQPVIYSTDRVKEAFGNINAKFCQNWIRVVVDAVLDRLVMMGWNANDNAANDTLDSTWGKMDLFRDAMDAHRDALVTGESFIIAWRADPSAQVDVYWNDARMCHMFYDQERPRIKRFAAKWWRGDDKTYRMTLYYPDRIEYYIANSAEMPSSANAFMPADPPTAINPYGIIPMFHFRGESELNSIIYLQDAVNKLFADMMVAAEFGAFRQRWIIGNFDPATVKNSQYETLLLGGGDGEGQATSVGQFDTTPLETFLGAIDKVASSIAIISRTPKHYLYGENGTVSGEALMAMEAPLVKKVLQRQELFGTTWRELGAFLLRLQSGTVVDPSDIQPVWQPAESIQPYTQAQTRQLAVSTGIPLVTQLRNEGWQQNEIDQMEQDRKDEQKQSLATGQLLLQQARVAQEQNNNPFNNGNNHNNEDNQND